MTHPWVMQLGPHSQLWECRACGAEFVWHPGFTNQKQPSECPCCEHEDPSLLDRIEVEIEE